MSAQRRAERDTLAADIAAVMRVLQRLRPDALREHVWLHLEAAQQDLAQAKRSLQQDTRREPSGG